MIAFLDMAKAHRRRLGLVYTWTNIGLSVEVQVEVDVNKGGKLNERCRIMEKKTTR